MQVKKFRVTETSSLYLCAVCPVSAKLKDLHGCVFVSLHWVFVGPPHLLSLHPAPTVTAFGGEQGLFICLD